MRSVQTAPQARKLEAVTSAEATVAPDKPASTLFVPLLLTLLSLLVWFGFQGWQVWKDHGNYAAAVQRQGPRLERAQEFRVEFESLSSDTAHLAAVGNANAKLLVDALKQRGIAIEPDQRTAAAAGGTNGPLNNLPVFSQTPVEGSKK